MCEYSVMFRAYLYITQSGFLIVWLSEVKKLCLDNCIVSLCSDLIRFILCLEFYLFISNWFLFLPSHPSCNYLIFLYITLKYMILLRKYLLYMLGELKRGGRLPFTRWGHHCSWLRVTVIRSLAKGSILYQREYSHGREVCDTPNCN